MKAGLIHSALIIFIYFLISCGGSVGNEEDAGQEQDAHPDPWDVLEGDMSPDMHTDMPVDDAADAPIDPVDDDFAGEEALDITVDQDIIDTSIDETSPLDLPEEEEYGVPGIVGDPCSGPEECLGVPDPARDCYHMIGIYSMPGGYCSAVCLEDSSCGIEGRCVLPTIYIPMKMCMRLCESNADCREDEGYTCQRLPLSPNPNNFCLPPF